MTQQPNAAGKMAAKNLAAANSCCANRRGFLRSAVAGSVLWPGMVHLLSQESEGRSWASDDAAGQPQGDPLQAKPAQFAPKAKAVIFLFMSGGVSHVDTFDPKPQLHARHGQEVMLDHPETRNRAGYEKLFLKRPGWEFRKYGQSGIEVSDLFPSVAEHVDDLAIIRSMHTSHSNHYNATLGMHTGSFAFSRPSIGSWISYGLGSENKNLPSFVVIAPQMPYAGTQVWASDFLSGAHQGTRVVPGAEPVANLTPRVSPDHGQRIELDALTRWEQSHLEARGRDDALASRIRSFETAFGMQFEMPAAFDLNDETDETLELYGMSRGETSGFGWQCLAARRLVERGVRFVELIDTGSSGNWDSHGNMADHQSLAGKVDRPIAGLLADLKRRGLGDDVLVVWTTEFGRTPFNSSADHPGREHHSWAFSSWLAGAGVRRGITYGATDEIGMRAEVDPVHVHDFHATILHLMGIDHTRLTFRHAGRDYRLTDVHGNVVQGVMA